MALAMSYFGMVVGALMLLLFGLDLAIGIPFGGADMLIDILFVIAGAMVGYLGWDAKNASS